VPGAARRQLKAGSQAFFDDDQRIPDPGPNLPKADSFQRSDRDFLEPQLLEHRREPTLVRLYPPVPQSDSLRDRGSRKTSRLSRAVGVSLHYANPPHHRSIARYRIYDRVGKPSDSWRHEQSGEIARVDPLSLVNGMAMIKFEDIRKYIASRWNAVRLLQ